MYTMGNLMRQRALIVLLMKCGHFEFQQPNLSVRSGMGGASRGAVVYLFTFFFLLVPLYWRAKCKINKI